MIEKTETDTSRATMKQQARSWFAVVRTYQECHRRYARLLSRFGLTVTQFDVLSAIHRRDNRATPCEIAEELLVTRGNITGVLQRLRDNGLITTQRHQADGRSFICAMTPEGETVMIKARTAASLFIATQMAPFDESALKHTERQMDEMHEHLLSIDPEAIATEVITQYEPTT